MKPVILFIIICVIGYFVWQSSNKSSQPRIVKPPVLTEPLPLPTGKAATSSSSISPTPPPTPEEQLQAMIRGAPVDATRLAVLCEKHPSQANVILTGKKIKVTGIIKRLMVRGIQSADMDIDLVGTPKYIVTFSTDYARYNTEHTGRQSYAYKLVKSEKMLLMYSNGGSYSTLNHVVHTEGDKVTLEGHIESIRPSSIKIHYAKGIVN